MPANIQTQRLVISKRECPSLFKTLTVMRVKNNGMTSPWKTQ
jgi:hypothetical protein